MSIFQLRPDSEKYQWLTMADEDDFAVETSLRGKPIQAKWKPLRVIPLVEAGMPDDPLSDYPTLGSTPTVSRRAVDVLRPMLEANGELLELISDVGEFYVFNVTTIVDVLDEVASTVTRFHSSNRVQSIDDYAFRNARIDSLTIFKIPQLPKGRPLVTDAFVSAVSNAGLTGFRFERLWSPVG